ncbi:major facilitator superfamily transporter [Ceratobasidium sp. AG-Ba]|nr:major facilitator superfamily transporter [Ceratobasidium sp. AG-Ba]QRW14923.1 major facilitator superfamily transporter [Ceratobasidium sp. AG-Ba]
MSEVPPESHPSTTTMLSIAPAGLRERRASTHIPPSSRDVSKTTSVSAVPESVVFDAEDTNLTRWDRKADSNDSPQIPTLSRLPSLYIDKQSASISGYTPGTLTPGYSGANTPAVTSREAYFEDSFARPALQTDIAAVRLKRRLAVSFFGFFCAGWSDGITGTILPRFEEAYHVSYLVVSLLFIASTFGFAVGTVAIEPLFNSLGRFSLSTRQRRFFPVLPSGIPNPQTGVSISQGRCGILLVGALCQCVYFTIAAARGSFPAMIVGFMFSGIGISLLSGQSNAYVAAQKSAGRYLGWLHGCYGIGAFASPLIGQTLLAKGWQWPRFFLISVCLSLINSIATIYTFHTTKEEFLAEKAKARQEIEAFELQSRIESNNVDEQLEDATSSRRRSSRSRGAGERSAMRMTINQPFVWIFALFLCTYTGSETTNGGWIVTFLLNERNANPDTVGYVASGFWGGLALGRLCLGQASPYIGIRREKHLVHFYIGTDVNICGALLPPTEIDGLGIALLMTVLVWKVPSFVGNAFCTAIIGFVLGPIFPTSLSLATKLLPAEIHMTALATMSSFASIGSALYPFVTGAIANAKGVAVLQPVMLGILSVMAGLWCLFPTRTIG